MQPNPIDRFQSHLDTSGGINACHPWTASRNHNGYGWFRISGETVLAHRWLLGYLRGAQLSGEERACHHCDNPPCCNARHLYVGTQAQNLDDACRRGRARNVTAEKNAAKGKCLRGHGFTADNTYVTPDGRRQCRACNRIRDKKRNRQ